MKENLKCKIIICDYVQTKNTKSGVQNEYTNILPEIVTLYIPTHFTFTISLQLIGNFAINKTKHIFGKIYLPNEELLSTFCDVLLSDILENTPSSLESITLNFELHNIPLSTEGNYSIKILLDEEVIQTDIIAVRKVH